MTPKRKSLRLTAYVGITLLALNHTIRRMMIEESIRPFDWWMLAIEVGVLLLVAYEVGTTVTHQIKEAKRRKTLHEIEAELRRLIVSGEAIKKAIPEYIPDLDWPNSVHKWVEDVEAYLTPLSSKALSEFNSYAHPNPRYRDYQGQFGHIRHASGYSGDMLETLNMKLENLRRIAQNPDSYLVDPEKLVTYFIINNIYELIVV